MGFSPDALAPTALEAFLGQAVSDAAAAVSVLLTHLGDRLGLYAAMADCEPVTAEDLAARTGTTERLVHEWLCNQAAGGYVSYDPGSGTFRLPPEHVLALASEASPALIQGLFDLVAAVYRSTDNELNVFRTGTGLTWAEQHPSLFPATERSFRPGYRAHLVQEWIPALDGVHDKLSAGARVADVGCGYGASTIVLARAYPNSSFIGYDYHGPSLETARAAAAEAGVADRVDFIEADATEIAGPYDLITFFDCWHDTADPLGVARAARNALADGGTVLAVEPLCGDRIEDNMNPLGRFGYGISTLVCTPCSISDGGPDPRGVQGQRRPGQLWTRRYCWAHRCRIPEFTRLAKTLSRYKDTIHNTLDGGPSNGRAEALNAQVNALITRARGFRSAAALVAMIDFVHGGLLLQPHFAGDTSVTSNDVNDLRRHGTFSNSLTSTVSPGDSRVRRNDAPNGPTRRQPTDHPERLAAAAWKVNPEYNRGKARQNYARKHGTGENQRPGKETAHHPLARHDGPRIPPP